MSKKGAFIYQQIELTTAEWATNTTVYPASVWLFERLESGKFNMKLADGVHTFVELPAVMQDVTVVVKTNDKTAYILTITTAAGSFDTPNLRPADGVGARVEVVSNSAVEYKLKLTSASGEVTTPNLKGQNGESYDDTTVRNALTALQSQINALVSGNASSAIESFNEIIAFLSNVEDSQTLSGLIAGINQSIANIQAAIPSKLSQLQNDDHTVKDANYVHTDNNYNGDEKQKVTDSLRLKEYQDVASLSALPSNVYNLRYEYRAATPQAIAFADLNSVPEMQEFYLSLKNSSGSDIDQPLPNGGDWLSDDPSVKLPNGKPTGISLKKEFGVIVVRY